MKKLVKILKGLANERRLKILQLLEGDTEKNVSSLSEELNLSFRSTSRHLRKMLDLGILKTRQTRNNMFYSLDKDETGLIKHVLKLIKRLK